MPPAGLEPANPVSKTGALYLSYWGRDGTSWLVSGFVSQFTWTTDACNRLAPGGGFSMTEGRGYVVSSCAGFGVQKGKWLVIGGVVAGFDLSRDESGGSVSAETCSNGW